MIALLAALLLAAPARPLGPFEKAGLPVPLLADDGQLTWTHPIQDRLPAEALLIGLHGDAPGPLLALLSERGRVVHIELDRLPAQAWRSLDLFDAIVSTRREAPADALLTKWLEAGGWLLAPLAPDTNGLGRLFPDALALAEGLAAPRARFPARPAAEIWPYELLEPPEGGEGAQTTARTILLATAAGLLLQMLLLARRRISRPFAFGGMALLSLAACGAAALRSAEEYHPVARGRIELELAAPGPGLEDERPNAGVRRRIYEVFVCVGPGDAPPPDPLWSPVPFTSAPETTSFTPGVTRIFLREEWAADSRPLPPGSPPRGLRIAGWEVRGSTTEAPPRAGEGDPPLLGRFRAVAQR